MVLVVPTELVEVPAEAEDALEALDVLPRREDDVLLVCEADVETSEDALVRPLVDEVVREL